MSTPPRRGWAGWFERGRWHVVRACGRTTPRALECRVERGRLRGPDGASRCFAGRPPGGWGPRLPAPGALPPLDEVAARVHALAAAWEGRVRLTFTASAVRRRTANDTPGAPLRASLVWSLTGSLAPRGGGSAWPLGWSGAGDGRAWLAGPAGDQLCELARALDAARALEPGSPAVVLGPDAAAVMVHETLGHLVESIPGAPPLLGARISAEALSVSDDPAAAGGPACYAFDDENVRVLAPTHLVREGVVVGELHTPESARRAGTLPTPNARAASVWHEPLARMSNLVCHPGTATEEEMVARVGRGLYVRRLGEAGLSRAGVSARVVLAEVIDGGRLTGRLVSGGRVEDEAGLLRRVAEAGNAPRFRGNALCGRGGQLLFDVGTCAPALRLSHLRVVR